MNSLRRLSQSFRKSLVKDKGLNFDSEDQEPPISIVLGDTVLSYDNREWHAEGSVSDELIERNRILEGENQLLRYKLALLLDLLTAAKLDLFALQGHKPSPDLLKPTLKPTTAPNTNTSTPSKPKPTPASPSQPRKPSLKPAAMAVLATVPHKKPTDTRITVNPASPAASTASSSSPPPKPSHPRPTASHRRETSRNSFDSGSDDDDSGRRGRGRKASEGGVASPASRRSSASPASPRRATWSGGGGKDDAWGKTGGGVGGKQVVQVQQAKASTVQVGQAKGGYRHDDVDEFDLEDEESDWDH
ncbi:hypothetical protein HDU96_001943 [Phlyctochytrium bullatum]|nr:hypothetical protein HDU96_001943 [Phlyctochytrium bullatum]